MESGWRWWPGEPWSPSFRWSWRQPARQAPRPAQTGPRQAFLWSGANPPNLILSLCSLVPPPSSPLASYLCFTRPGFFIYSFFLLFLFELVFHESKCSYEFQLGNKERKKRESPSPGTFSLVNSCSCMQMPANIFRIYPVETLPSMKTHSIVLFKGLRPRMWPGGEEREEAGWGGDKGGNGHTRFSIY